MLLQIISGRVTMPDKAWDIELFVILSDLGNYHTPLTDSLSPGN